MNVYVEGEGGVKNLHVLETGCVFCNYNLVWLTPAFGGSSVVVVFEQLDLYITSVFRSGNRGPFFLFSSHNVRTTPVAAGRALTPRIAAEMVLMKIRRRIFVLVFGFQSWVSMSTLDALYAGCDAGGNGRRWMGWEVENKVFIFSPSSAIAKTGLNRKTRRITYLVVVTFV